jgi:succinyl-CoA synthetase beta subunit
MRLQEYQAKSLFAGHGLPIPRGSVTATPEEARRLAQDLGGAVAVKAQVRVGGRGKAGGIRLADTPEAAEETAAAILQLQIGGLPVRTLLVEEAVDICQEIYLGLVVDRSLAQAVMMASAEGGIEIEQVARDRPAAIVRAAIDPLQGLDDAQTGTLAEGIGLPAELHDAFDEVARGLYAAFVAHDALLAEINPLAVVGEGRLLALDAKMVIDDNALYRHPDLIRMQADAVSVGKSGAASAGEESPIEQKARADGLSYVHLGGEIGCVVNGAGLAMATMDVIQLYGGVPANFLDVGGGASKERVAAALRLVLYTPGIRVGLVNIFGGITLCDQVAQGIVTALDEADVRLPLVVRLMGTNEAQGQAILEQGRRAGHQLIAASTLAEAARTAVALAASEQG